jgi:lipoprotein-releasing system permease protein
VTHLPGFFSSAPIDQMIYWLVVGLLGLGLVVFAIQIWRRPLTLLIAWRYLRRPTDRLVSAVGIVSILGLVVGVMALVISMALMTGYRTDLERKLLGGNAEIFVYAIDGYIPEISALVETIEEIPGIAEASPVIFQYSLVASESTPTGQQVMLKGIDVSRTVDAPMLQRIVGPTGVFRTADGSATVAIGRHLADRLRIEAGDSISVTVPTQDAGSVLPRTEVYVVSRVYQTGFHEYDARWIFTSLENARELVHRDDANLVEVKLQPGAEIDAIVREIELRTDRRFSVSDWRQMNRQLFALLSIQQLVLFIVIGLIVFVSTFNIVSTLIMTVHEKRREIGILLALGADRRMIRRIFIWYGTLVGFAGTALGLLLGVVVCWILTRYELISFGPEISEVYFVSSIPFITDLRDLGVIALFAAIVSWLATLIPSMRSARLSPVDALRAQ